MKSIILYGPAGCGKTHNNRIIADRFKLSEVFDGWNSVNDHRGFPMTNTLLITNSRPTPEQARGLRIVEYKKLNLPRRSN